MVCRGRPGCWVRPPGFSRLAVPSLQPRLFPGQPFEIFAIGRQLFAKALEGQFGMLGLIADRPGDTHEIRQV